MFYLFFYHLTKSEKNALSEPFYSIRAQHVLSSTYPEARVEASFIKPQCRSITSIRMQTISVCRSRLIVPRFVTSAFESVFNVTAAVAFSAAN